VAQTGPLTKCSTGLPAIARNTVYTIRTEDGATVDTTVSNITEPIIVDDPVTHQNDISSVLQGTEQVYGCDTVEKATELDSRMTLSYRKEHLQCQ